MQKTLTEGRYRTPSLSFSVTHPGWVYSRALREFF